MVDGLHYRFIKTNKVFICPLAQYNIKFNNYAYISLLNLYAHASFWNIRDCQRFLNPLIKYFLKLIIVASH